MKDEKCLLSIKTKYTEEEYIKFNKFHMLRRGNRFLKYFIFNIAVLILVIIYIMTKWYLYAVFLCLLAIVLDVVVLTTPKRLVKKVIKSDSIFGKYDNTVNFYESYIEITNEKSYSKINYDEFYKAYKYKNNFYVYINKNSAILFLSKDLSVEDVEKISNILSEKMFDKFIIVN